MAFLRAFGAYLPSRVVDNHELAAETGTDAEWILRATGIVERRFAAPDESVASLGIRAEFERLIDQRRGLAAQEQRPPLVGGQHLRVVVDAQGKLVRSVGLGEDERI